MIGFVRLRYTDIVRSYRDEYWETDKQTDRPLDTETQSTIELTLDKVTSYLKINWWWYVVTCITVLSCTNF